MVTIDVFSRWIPPAPEAASAPVLPWYPELICMALVLILISGFLLWRKGRFQGNRS